jgi:hypothetical protein
MTRVTPRFSWQNIPHRCLRSGHFLTPVCPRPSLTVMEMFKGIASSRASALSLGPSWDERSMRSGGASVDHAELRPGESSIMQQVS